MFEEEKVAATGTEDDTVTAAAEEELVQSAEQAEDTTPKNTEAKEEAAVINEQEAAELAKVKEEKEQLIARFHRLQADFDNYRKRVANEKKDWSTQTVCDVVRELLPVIDNLERALEASGSFEALKEGVELVYRQLLTALGKHGLEKIEACGKEFDPNYHYAIMQVESEQPENTVVEELQKGYKVKDRVVRASMVKVAKAN
ncbi:MAG: nucleotide exchange factor GrpE [Firmicutes bacterium]|nr:nucleotide exchange factor GrpE [Bacillota bacterium]